MVKILFVCLGNICRSPMAEGIFKKLVDENKLNNKITCDSAGTSDYHIGELPDYRMQQTAQKHGIELTHKARQLSKKDFSTFDYIIAMDESNFTHIKNTWVGANHCKIS
jgi:protein-tyrosine phosphatase